MDPVTALSLAANILQFVEFGTKLFTTGYQAYKSAKGQTDENEHIEKLTIDLESCAKSLKHNTQGFQGSLSDDDLALLELARRSDRLAQELLALLVKVQRKGKSRTWGAVSSAMRATWSKEEIQIRLKRLQEIQTNANTRLLNILRADLSTLGAAVQDLSNTSNSHHLENVRQLDTARLDILFAIREDSTSLKDALVQLSHNDSSAEFAAEKRHEDLLSKLSGFVQGYAEQVNSFDKAEKILSSLLFPAMNERRVTISPPEKHTFGWIFGEDETPRNDDEHSVSSSDSLEGGEEGDDTVPGPFSESSIRRSLSDLERTPAERDRRAKASELFRTWLRSENGLFYISGKAGSGKSTLMKFISDHPMTMELLGEWAVKQGKQLTRADFFFWNAGSAQQKTHEGLLRSLLFQILNQRRDLIPRALPQRWRGDRFTLSHPASQPWGLEELSNAIKGVTEYATSGDCCFCFFVDGLDEYQGEHRSLVRDIQGLCKSSFVKVCVSSRPWNIFQRAFGQQDNPWRLSLQDYTRSDINRFIHSHLSEDDKFKELVQAHGNAHDLIRNLERQADGVFLWVVFVVRELHAELDELGSYEELKDKLRTLPPDLDSFYRRILDGIHKTYKRSMARLLVLCLQRSTLPLVCVHFLYETSKGFDILRDDIPSVSQEVRTSWENEAKSKVNKWSRDLLEVDGNSWRVAPELSVRFSHRSVKDYLRQEHVFQELLTLAGVGFDVSFVYSELHLAFIKCLDDETAMSSSEATDYPWQKRPFFTKPACYALGEAVLPQSVGANPNWRHMVEEIDKACMEVWLRNGTNPVHWTASWLYGTSSAINASRSTFFMFAVQLGIFWYAQELVPEMSDEYFHSQAPYLLLATITPMYEPTSHWNQGESTKLIRQLLLRGANVNAEVEIVPVSPQGVYEPELILCTVWEYFLSEGTGNFFEADDYLCMLNLLLGHGADVHCAWPGFSSLGDRLVLSFFQVIGLIKQEHVIRLESLLLKFNIPVNWRTARNVMGEKLGSWDEARRSCP